MHLLEELATNTSLKSHFHLIQWWVHRLYLVFQTKGLALDLFSDKSAFPLEICMLLNVVNVPLLGTIMKPKRHFVSYFKCLLQSLIPLADLAQNLGRAKSRCHRKGISYSFSVIHNFTNIRN